MKTTLDQARKRDCQVDSVCAILYTLDVKKGRIRGDIGNIKAGAGRLIDKGKQIKSNLAKQSANSDFDFAQ